MLIRNNNNNNNNDVARLAREIEETEAKLEDSTKKFEELQAACDASVKENAEIKKKLEDLLAVLATKQAYCAWKKQDLSAALAEKQAYLAYEEYREQTCKLFHVAQPDVTSTTTASNVDDGDQKPAAK